MTKWVRILKLRHLPNLLTLLRIAVIPILVIAYYLPGGAVSSTIIFALACITDWFDGFLARRLNISSSLGAFLDPVADKLIVAVALIVVLSRIDYIVIPVAIIIGREIVVSALREWMAELGRRTSVAVTYVSKIKTTVQMVAIGFLLASGGGTIGWIIHSGCVLIYIAALLTLWTMVIYLRASWDHFKASM
ncbi:MAG: CDP-diacylglycerol--glycerol-3-phosphate 3-phosphatidyltransferase [Gammaproteobacteria bacterium]|nr:CDP-diacylglycerol--glycerol-3-phosphate 3-phosphatidyltransferase [Gammaproteobacteria bacterium]